MAEATPSIQQSPTIRITTAAHMLAQIQSRKVVKEQLRREGQKVTHYCARDISIMANEYLAEHREELIGPAKATIERWTLAGEFGKRAQRALAQALCAKLTSDAQNGKAQSTGTSVVQMS